MIKEDIEDIKADIKRIEIGQAEIRGDIKALLVRLVLAFAAGLVKLFFPDFPGKL